MSNTPFEDRFKAQLRSMFIEDITDTFESLIGDEGAFGGAISAEQAAEYIKVNKDLIAQLDSWQSFTLFFEEELGGGIEDLLEYAVKAARRIAERALL